MKIDCVKLGERIRSYRISLNLSQEELSEMTSVNRVHIGNIENGKKIPGIEVLSAISTALDVPIDILLKDSIPSWESDNIDFIMLNSSKEEKSNYIGEFKKFESSSFKI